MTCKYGEAKEDADGTMRWAGGLFPCSSVLLGCVTQGILFAKSGLAS